MQKNNSQRLVAVDCIRVMKRVKEHKLGNALHIPCIYCKEICKLLLKFPAKRDRETIIQYKISSQFF